MKNHLDNSVPAALLAAAALFCGWLPAHAAPPEKSAVATVVQDKAPPPKQENPRSVFIIPANAAEGRDPFFPNSNRVSGGTPSKSASSTSNALLVWNGRGGTLEHPLVMINGRTFAAGEESEVPTQSGRVRVRCIEIKGDSVLVEVGGERRELHFQDR